ncbi:hypothetical protein V8E51_001085 [Hyaloscypha variabilis]
MAGTKKINKAKARPTVIATYEVLAGMDGNPNTPKEFDEDPHTDGEVFFKAEDDATKVEKNKITILNFIHQDLHHDTARTVPALTSKDNSDIEVYHRATYNGVELDVCVYWPPREEGDFKSCVALVKFSSDDLSDEHGENGVISADASWNQDAKADKFTVKNDKLTKNYWAPRWKYVVNALRTTAYERYEKNGVYIPEPEPEVVIDDKDEQLDSNEEREEEMEVYSGSIKAIIGTKGAKIQEIRATSRVTDIKMPAKNEDGPRLKARELVTVTIMGKGRAIKTAREMIQAVVDEWANAPRPPRDGGNNGGFSTDSANDFHGNGGSGESWGGNNEKVDTTTGGDWEVGAHGGGDNDGGAATQSWDSGAGGGGW